MPKLTEDQKASIRARLAAGESSQAIGASMDVSPFIIQRYAPKRDPGPERPFDVVGAIGMAPGSPVEAALETLARQLELRRMAAAGLLQTQIDRRQALEEAIETARNAVQAVEAQQEALATTRRLLAPPEEPR